MLNFKIFHCILYREKNTNGLRTSSTFVIVVVVIIIISIIIIIISVVLEIQIQYNSLLFLL